MYLSMILRKGLYILSLLIPLFYFSTLQGQVTTWLGIDSAYNQAYNWSNGVPNGTQSVCIPATSKDPITIGETLTIGIGDTLEVKSGATLFMDGINQISYCLDLNGYMINRGTIQLKGAASTSIFHRGESLLNDTCGLIQIDSSLSGIIVDGGGFLNKGSIGIENVDQDGMIMRDSFVNHGSIYLDEIGYSAFYFPGGYSSFFENFGLIRVSTVTYNVYDIIELDSFINRPCGQIYSSGSGEFPLDSRTTNQGTIVENANGTSGIGSNTGTIYNLFGGSFTVSSGTPAITTASLPGTYNWSGDINRCWTCTGNWSEGLIPDGGQNVHIPDTLNDPLSKGTRIILTSTYTMTVDSGATLSIDGLNKLDHAIETTGQIRNYGSIRTRNVNDYAINLSQDTLKNYKGATIELKNGSGGFASSSSGILYNMGGFLVDSSSIGIFSQGQIWNWGTISVYRNFAIAMNNYGYTLNRGMFKFESPKFTVINHRSGGIWDNYGLLYVDSTSAAAILTHSNADTFVNHPCGEILVTKQGRFSDGDSVIVNKGTIEQYSSQNSTLARNYGYIGNYGGGTFTIYSDMGFYTEEQTDNPSTFVFNTTDDGPGTLRQAIRCAEPCDTIKFDSVTFSTTGLAVRDSSIKIDKCLSIIGPESKLFKVALEGFYGDNYRLMEICDSGIDVTLKNLQLGWGGGTFYTSDGGGIYNMGNLNLYNCIFTNNKTSESGGALYNAPTGTINSCLSLFENNSSLEGSVLYNNGNAHFANAVMRRNLSNDVAPTIYNKGNATIKNSTIALNSCEGELAFHTSGSFFRMVNSISTFNYVDEGIFSGSGTTENIRNYIAQDPLFQDTALNDLRLLPCSPAIDAGLNDSVPNKLTLDWWCNPRMSNDSVDIGAYEYPGKTDGFSKLHVAINSNGDGTSWASPLPSLYDAFELAKLCPVDSILAAEGEYPYPGGSRSSSYIMCDSLTLLGGYSMDGSMRNPDSLITIISGDRGTPMVSSDNLYHVVTIPDSVTYSKIDGVIITDGNANGVGPSSEGGAIFCEGSALFNHVIIENNFSKEGGPYFT